MRARGLIRIFAAIAAAATLGGCYATEKPLIGPADADQPYRRITYSTEGSTTQSVLVRQKGSYQPVGATQGEELRFKRLSGDLYVAQFKTKTNGREAYIYGLLQVDVKNKVARNFLSIYDKAQPMPAGFTPCFERWACFRDLATYADLASRAIAAGAKPDAEYRLVKLE